MKWTTVRIYLFSLSLVLSALLLPRGSFAQQFYPDSQSIYYDSSTTAKFSTILATSTRTILGISLMTDTSNKTEVLCGQEEMFDNWGNNNVPFTPVQYICNDAVYMKKTSNSALSVVVTYSDGLLSTSTNSGGYTGANFQEWLFVSCVFLFFISFGTWRRILSPFLTRVQ